VVYTAFLEEGNDRGTIDVGFLVREDIIRVDAVVQLGKDETFIDPVDGDVDIVHDRPPLLLEGACLLDFSTFPIRVMVVHNRSFSSIDDPDRGPFVREKRLQQANSIAQKAQAIQDAEPGARFVVTGDFNDFEFTDGYVDVVGRIAGDFNDDDDLVIDPTDYVDPDLTNELPTLIEEERYSFVFRGSGEAIDHMLTSEGLGPFVVGVDFGRGNADAAFDLINDGSTPLRASDHDGLVLFIAKDSDGDGVADDLDVCPETVIPESVPTRRLGTNRWALVDDDGIFDTKRPNGGGGGNNRSYTVGDTAGCSCEQIIEELHLGNGHTKFGCSIGAMENWIDLVQP
jgi:predicted extracellular nuclease